MESHGPVAPLDGVQVAHAGRSRMPLVHDVDHGRDLSDLGGHFGDIVLRPGDAGDQQRFLSVQGRMTCSRKE